MVKWYSVTQYVDIETGELLTKTVAKGGRYLYQGHSERIENKEGYNLKIRTNEFKRSTQCEIRFPE